MKRIILAVVLAAPTMSQAENVEEILARELVEVVQGKYVHTQVNLCRVGMSDGGKNLSRLITVRREIDAPERLLSRDQFVFISTQLLVRNRIALASVLRPGIDPVDAFSAIECRRVTKPVDATDFRIAVRMAQAGVTIETTNQATGKQAIDRFEWREILNLESE